MITGTSLFHRHYTTFNVTINESKVSFTNCCRMRRLKHFGICSYRKINKNSNSYHTILLLIIFLWQCIVSCFIPYLIYCINNFKTVSFLEMNWFVVFDMHRKWASSTSSMLISWTWKNLLLSICRGISICHTRTAGSVLAASV